MKKFIIKRLDFLQTRYLVLVFLVMSVLMLASAIIELLQSKKELLHLMQQQSHTLSESLVTASRNTLSSNYLIEDLIEERLLNHAGLIKKFYESGKVSNNFLKKYAEENNIFRINIFLPTGEKIYSSHWEAHQDFFKQVNASDVLKPIFRGEKDTLIIGLKTARFSEGYRYAIAVGAVDHSAIVVNLDAEQLMEFRRHIGYGSLLQSITLNPGIIYAALQDTSGILAASGNVQELPRIVDSPFLSKALNDSLFLTHITQFENTKVLEAIHPFFYEGELIGIFRLGLSLEPLNSLNSRIYRRIIIISIILLIVGFFLFSFLLIRQNLDIIHKKYQEVETFSQNIIQNVNDAIIVYKEGVGISVFNTAAEKLFGIKAEKITGNSFDVLFDKNICEEIITSEFTLQELQCPINNQTRNLLVSKNAYVDMDNKKTISLIIRDLTEQKRLEKQIQRREKLSAMGQLASGVAHEIRNPLNAISTVIQQLDQDFTPQENVEEYHQLARMVYREVRRINQTIENFLKFARPEPLHLSQIQITEFFDDLKKEYQSFLKSKNIFFQTDLKFYGSVFWDKEKMRQAFINLIQNSIEAIKEDGSIKVQVYKLDDNWLNIEFTDNGPGIPKEIQNKIFNLYFTTKPDGTGIGLSIVQRIIDQHNGSIHLESTEGKGSKFIISLPIQPESGNSRG